MGFTAERPILQHWGGRSIPDHKPSETRASPGSDSSRTTESRRTHKNKELEQEVNTRKRDARINNATTTNNNNKNFETPALSVPGTAASRDVSPSASRRFRDGTVWSRVSRACAEEDELPLPLPRLSPSSSASRAVWELRESTADSTADASL